MQTLSTIQQMNQKVQKTIFRTLQKEAQSLSHSIDESEVLYSQIEEGVVAIAPLSGAQPRQEKALGFFALDGLTIKEDFYQIRFGSDENGPESYFDLLNVNGKLVWSGKLSVMPLEGIVESAGPAVQFQSVRVVEDASHPGAKIWILGGILRHAQRRYAFTMRLDTDKYRPGYWN